MLISVIIPVYNVENYLVPCIESVLNQSYTNFEIILVNDGSVDSSPTICDNFAQRDSRVKVIHKKNGGLSDARNTGTAVACGEYIIYLDGDDFWANDNVLEQLVAAAKETPECDFIGFNCSYYFEDENRVIPWVSYDDEITKPVSALDSIYKLIASGTFPISACLKLIRKKSFDGRITFIKDKIAEDIPWFIELLRRTHKCRFVNLYMYMYRRRALSITSSFSQKSYNDLFSFLEAGVKNVCNDEYSAEYRFPILSFWAYELCILRGMTGFMDKHQRRRELNRLYAYNWLFEYTLHPKVKKVSILQKILGKSITDYLLYRYLGTRFA